MENWLICWEGIASTKLFMVATLMSKLPFMYVLKTKFSILFTILHTTVCNKLIENRNSKCSNAYIKFLLNKLMFFSEVCFSHVSYGENNRD